jgi:magnesium chelatase subunit H
MKITVFYVGSSLLKGLRRAEREINRRHQFGLRLAAHNCMQPPDAEWPAEGDVAESDIVFVLHVTDGEQAALITSALERHRTRVRAVIVINSMGGLMRLTRVGRLDLSSHAGRAGKAAQVLWKLSSWMKSYTSGRASHGPRRPERYLRLLSQAPALMRFVPSVGALADAKHYCTLFCYFLQPTPANIEAMILQAITHSIPGHKRLRTPAPERMPSTGIYHPDAPSLFEAFDIYRGWYDRDGIRLQPENTIGVLLLRPQVISGARRHYDYLIRALEAEGLAVIPVVTSLMDNREACERYLMDRATGRPRVSQLLSLAGFSFVGGPARNDSQAAVEYLKGWKVPLRSAVSLEQQGIESWADSMIGLNPLQTAMQVAIPEVDGATEPFVFGGLPAGGDEPQPLEERCKRLAARVARWNRLARLPAAQQRLAFLVYCFPPNRGNLGTAADLDVFESLLGILRRLRDEGHAVEPPQSAEALRDAVASGCERFAAADYYRLCPWVGEIEAEWGAAPGRVNARGQHILITGARFGNVFIAVQPTFGYEGDPMRLLMAKGGTPHHGFMGLYTWLEHVYRADALVHVGTHGALEFMPGKQAGLSGRCWPDRLIGNLPNLYIYSVNNPAEGSIAKRRSYASLVSYLTPPMECAGLYKDLASLKELIAAYRQCRDEEQRERLFPAIEDMARALKLLPAAGDTKCQATLT